MSRTLGWTAAAALLLATTLVWADDAEETQKIRHFRAGPVAVGVASEAGGAPEEVIRLGEYWIGVECRPVVDPTLRSQLNLPESQGLVVLGVATDSPAAKAGIREHDVLLKAGNQAMTRIQDLIDAVEKAKEQKLSVELLRGGKKITVDVPPTKRPPEATMGARHGHRLLPPDDADVRSVEKWMERVVPGFGGQGPFQFHIMRPGTILPPGASLQPELPDGTTVMITRTGSEPAKIVVERGKERWEVTEKELDKLPADVRAHVERMLSPWHALGHRVGAAAAAAKAEAVEKGTAWLEEHQKSAAKQLEEAQKTLEKQMQDMNRRMEQMKKSLEQMEKSVPKPKAPEKTKGEKI
jgi:hypothetical protein